MSKKYMTKTVQTSEGPFSINLYNGYGSITPRTNREVAYEAAFKVIHKHFRKKGWGNIGCLMNHSKMDEGYYRGLKEVVGESVTTYHGTFFRLSGSVWEDKEAGTMLHDEGDFHIIIKNRKE